MQLMIAGLLAGLCLVQFGMSKEFAELVPFPKMEHVTTDEKGNKLFEGDIQVLPEDKNKGGSDRNAINGDERRWPKVGKEVIVPYTYNGVGAKAKQQFEESAEDYAKWTCVKFVPRSNQKNYIQVYTGEGCHSLVGKHPYAQMQELSLGPGCENAKGVVAHEMMHALGFYHEQSRSDRDQFVEIIEHNIKPGLEDQFEKCHDCTSPNTAYDYESIMHYEADAFKAGEGLQTIRALRPLPSGLKELGQRNGIDANDVKKINDMYHCGGHTIKSHSGETIPSRQPRDMFSNCCDFSGNAAACQQANIKEGCPVTCGPNPKC